MIRRADYSGAERRMLRVRLGQTAQRLGLGVTGCAYAPDTSCLDLLYLGSDTAHCAACAPSFLAAEALLKIEADGAPFGGLYGG